MNDNRTKEPEITEAEIDQFLAQIREDAAMGGYRLNPDLEFTRDLARSLLINQQRYGYPSCPCRLASGKREGDRDIVCPCDYRDPDLNEYNACYCALYVTEAVAQGQTGLKPVPERRMRAGQGKREGATPNTNGGTAHGVFANPPYPVWRCKVCGYLCARDNPPELCPICKAKQERFERFG